MPTRQEMWNRLGDPVDLLVIGGGITGAGIARDAGRRGLKVALVEMQDLAYGTSSRSSKLVHGGLRYLEHYEFSLVFESVSERRILMDIAPHLVNPLGFLFPVFKGSKRKLWLVETGMWLYDGLSLFRTPKLHRTLDPAQVGEEEPALTTEGLSGAPLYYDCYTDDARLTLETALDAAAVGATVATWAKVVSFVKETTGRVVGAVVEDGLTGELKEVRAPAVINATGPWTDRTISMSKPLSTGSLLRPTKGVHIVVERDKLPVNNAVVCFHPTDDRPLFAIPWEECTYIGTTDTDFDDEPGTEAATLEDVDYLIAAAARYFPDHPIHHDDVLSTWAGLRPLMKPPSVESDIEESSVSREHQIIVGRDGLITIAGGKLTTYRRMAAETVDTAVKLLRLSDQLPGGVTEPNTDREPLPGAVGWPDDDDHEAVAAQVHKAGGGRIDINTARLLANTYGMLSIDIARMTAKDPELAVPLVEGRPEVLAQVDWAVREELAATVSDVLHRRTQVYFKDPGQGMDAAEQVAARMATLIGWTEAQKAHSLQDYRDDVSLSCRWREELK
ncbi:MAG: glycerol-3-phosphate dehydrogenase/oxidase [Deltaproteobacteria bacterium]|nr:glycerol-3-phosphate dehydrogenase/oxidase [Deltaproteobacteria bacterium]MBW2253603.1 glycerol-3-phosphate dehydrogenase/oxidase [Deltaproteobacteria bacterium]